MPDLSTSRSKRAILLGVAIVFCAWILWSTRGILYPFVIGAVVAYVLAPLVDAVHRQFLFPRPLQFLARPLAILVTYALLGCVLMLAGFYLVPPLINQTIDFADNLPDHWQQVQREALLLNEYYRDHVPVEVRQRIEANLETLGTQVASAAQTTLTVTFSALGAIIGFLIGLVLIPIWMFYVLKDQHSGLSKFYSMWPDSLRTDVRNVLGIIDRILGAYIRVQLMLGVVIGVVTGVAMWAIGIPQALVLGLIAGLLEFIPYLGPWMAFFVAAIVTLATEPDKILWVALAFLLIQQAEGNLLVPKLQGDAVNINPAIVMILLAIGGSLWGIVGMLVIVPLSAIVRDVFVYVFLRIGEEPATDDLAIEDAAVVPEGAASAPPTHGGVPPTVRLTSTRVDESGED